MEDEGAVERDAEVYKNVGSYFRTRDWTALLKKGRNLLYQLRPNRMTFDSKLTDSTDLE